MPPLNIFIICDTACSVYIISTRLENALVIDLHYYDLINFSLRTYIM